MTFRSVMGFSHIPIEPSFQQLDVSCCVTVSIYLFGRTVFPFLILMPRYPDLWHGNEIGAHTQSGAGAVVVRIPVVVHVSEVGGAHYIPEPPVDPHIKTALYFITFSS